jgi:predicted Zn-dependent peptidase
MMRVYAGIDRKERLRVMKLIRQQLSDMKLGKFSDEDLLLSKKVLTTDAKLSQDRVSTIIEEAYNRSIYGDQVRTYSQWIDAVNSVSREEIMAVAKGIKLQAVYFMEGIQ